MPQYNQGGGSVSRDGGGTLFPLQGLNPYTNGRWMIRVRVMSKDKRTYRNAKGEGKLCMPLGLEPRTSRPATSRPQAGLPLTRLTLPRTVNVLVADNTGDIRMTGFNETLDQYYERLTVGRCYVVSGGTIKQANPQYNNTSHSCEITLGRQTTIEDSEEPSGPGSMVRVAWRDHTHATTPPTAPEAHTCSSVALPPPWASEESPRRVGAEESSGGRGALLLAAQRRADVDVAALHHPGFNPSPNPNPNQAQRHRQAQLQLRLD